MVIFLKFVYIVSLGYWGIHEEFGYRDIGHEHDEEIGKLGYRFHSEYGPLKNIGNIGMLLL